MKYFIGADLGTSALKLLLVDVHGEILKAVSRSYSVYYPKPAWSEQNPEDWWNAFLSGVKELVQDIKHGLWKYHNGHSSDNSSSSDDTIYYLHPLFEKE